METEDESIAVGSLFIVLSIAAVQNSSLIVPSGDLAQVADLAVGTRIKSAKPGKHYGFAEPTLAMLRKRPPAGVRHVHAAPQ